MDSTIVAYVSLFALGVFVGLAISKYGKAKAHIMSLPVNREIFHGTQANPTRNPIDSTKASDMIRRDPMRKRPGLATLRHQAEMESMKPVTEAEKRVAKNAEALS